MSPKIDDSQAIARAMSFPGMTTRQEREALFDWGRHRWEGFGELVDLGSWLGSLIAPLAEGLRHHSKIRPPFPSIHAYERFQYETWMEWEFSRHQLAIPPRVGDSYEPLFWELIEPWKEQVVLHRGDVMTHRWSGKPIELLVVDVMKSWPLASFTLQEFFPHLVPGRSWLMHQDFAHWATPWVALSMYRLREAFVVDHAVPGAGSVIFRLDRPLERELLSWAADPASYRPQECDEAIAWAKEVGCSTRRSELTLARLAHEVETKRSLSIGSPLRQALIESVGEANPTIPEASARGGLNHPKLDDRLNQLMIRWLEVYPSSASWCERRALMDWARKEWKGWGRAVDLGTGLGGMAVALAEGMRASGQSTQVRPCVQAIDPFVMKSWMAGFFETFHLPIKPVGESFRDLVEALISPWSDSIEIKEGEGESFAEEGPIEVLVIDCMNHWTQARQVCEPYLSRLRSGSLLVVREFFNPAHALAPLLLVAAKGELLFDRVLGETVWFRVQNAVSLGVLPTLLAEVDQTRINETIDWMSSITSISASMESRYRLTVSLLAERYQQAIEQMTKLAKSGSDERAFVVSLFDRVFEKMLYRLDWDEDWRQAIVEQDDDLAGGAKIPTIKAVYDRFNAYRRGEKTEPIIVSVDSLGQQNDSESGLVDDWRKGGELAVSLHWPGTRYLRFVR